ncbi:hypothetical protein N7462_001977 [Penicillium macrosclerotiorum]|uniref:uncharacterized protein n=1 Tax=Penicillium macrosclerotiorum TaxID=303699 RepID=UPI002548F8B2|nr:uncharacterized protein N7462_001977 [Penicillium macrosclerotiorum]KAJ5692554.1 hypothetical protein N7462_001977 [Penicillium macrosclerotiorum]
MGRRKIEIKAIKDDRNRSVTFLKRKGGLFKKAHELAVLCSVDVAVIIFGHNKKLYEYSSSDMHEALGRYQYFGPPHEHKGPDDFAGKRDDDDDDEEATPAPEEIQQLQQQGHPAMPPHLHQPGFQHINHAPSASPPIPNGLPITRHGTPQSHVSRPSSRNHVRRLSSNMSSHQHGTPPPPPAPQNGFAYMANPSMYNPNVHSNMNQPRPGQYAQYGHPQNAPQGSPPIHHQHGLPPQQMHPHQGPQHFQHPHTIAPQQQMGMPPGSHAPVQQVSQPYIPEQGRNSVPPAPAYAHENQSERAASVPEGPQKNAPVMLKTEPGQSPPQIKSLSKSRSIFTPIDDRGSVLARHFGAGVPTYESPQSNDMTRPELPQDGFSDHKPIHTPAASQTSRAPSIASTSDIKPPSRTNSGALSSKRPQLKVQIPSENSDHGSATGESSRDSAGYKTGTPAKDNPPAGVVLPPPSPSAGAILSAGAQGPPNPFARPPPPGSAGQNNYSTNNGGSQNNGNNSNNIETPISALPSRFVSDALLPSPSSFFPEWGFGRSGPDSNLLPSPLTFPTPAVQTGPSFSREDEQDKKRKSPDSGPPTEGTSKKPKT